MAKKKTGSPQPNYDHTTIDELLSSRLRLAIMAVLLGCEKCDFVFLREKTGATDGNLTAHCKKLEEAEYLKIEKKFVDRKPVTCYEITRKGRLAIKAYAEKLAQMITG